MESIIKVTQGRDFEKKGTCRFCGKSSTYVFGVIDTKNSKPSGHKLTSFYICDEHMEVFNTLLDGNKNINNLVKKQKKLTKKINLREFI